MDNSVRYRMPLWGVIPKEALTEIANSPRWETALTSIAMVSKPSPQEAENVSFFLGELAKAPSVTSRELRALIGLHLDLAFKYPFENLDALAVKMLSDILDSDHPYGSYNIRPANFVRVANKLCTLKHYETVPSMYAALRKSEELNNSFQNYDFRSDNRASSTLTEDIITLLQQGEGLEVQKFFKETLPSSFRGRIYLPIPLPLFDNTSWGASTQEDMLRVINHWYEAVSPEAQGMSLKQALMADTSLAHAFLAGKQTLAQQIKNRNLKGARRKALEHIAKGQPLTLDKLGGRGTYDVLTLNMIHYQGATSKIMLYPWGDPLADTLVESFFQRGRLYHIFCPLADDKVFLNLLEEKMTKAGILTKGHQYGVQSSSQWVSRIKRMFDRVDFMDEPVLEKCFVRAWQEDVFQLGDLECIEAWGQLIDRGQYGISVTPGALPGATLKMLHEYNVKHGTNLGNINNVSYLHAETREDLEFANQLTTGSSTPLKSLYMAARGPIFSPEEISKAMAGQEVQIGYNIVSSNAVIDMSAKHGADLGLSQAPTMFWSIFLDLAPHYCDRSRSEWIETALAASA